LHTTVKFGLQDIKNYDINTIFNIRYTQNLKSGRVDYYVCESFINCPKTVQVKFKDGFYEIYLCVSHKHNHEINAYKKRRKLLEKFIETESQSRDFKSSLQKYLKDNGFEELTSRQIYNMKYNLKKKIKPKIL
jgi:hypothetical protein